MVLGGRFSVGDMTYTLRLKTVVTRGLPTLGIHQVPNNILDHRGHYKQVLKY